MFKIDKLQLIGELLLSLLCGFGVLLEFLSLTGGVCDLFGREEELVFENESKCFLELSVKETTVAGTVPYEPAGYGEATGIDVEMVFCDVDVFVLLL